MGFLGRIRVEIQEQFEQGLAPGVSSVNIWRSMDRVSGELNPSFCRQTAVEGTGRLSALRCTPFFSPGVQARRGGSEVGPHLPTRPQGLASFPEDKEEIPPCYLSWR